MIYAIIFLTFFTIPHGQATVYAAGDARNSNSVSTCIETPELCSDQKEKKEQEVKDVSESNSANPFSMMTFFKMILALLFVLALIYVLLKLVNKKGNGLGNRRGYLQNVGGTSLGQNRSVQLVKIGNKVLVVGVGDSIQLLKEIDDAEEVREILQDHQSKFDNFSGSRDFMMNLFQNKRRAQILQDKNPHKEFGALLKEQLIELRKDRKDMYEQLGSKGNKQNE